MAFGGFTGGVTSVAMGESFWQGFATGAIVGGLNNGLHKMVEPPNDVEKAFRKSAKEFIKNNKSKDNLVDFDDRPRATGAVEHVYPEGYFMGGGALNKSIGGSKQWIRFGKSYSIKGKFNAFSLRWGAGGKHWKKIPFENLQKLNKNLRQLKFPSDNWRTTDPGHLHFFKIK